MRLWGKAAKAAGAEVSAAELGTLRERIEKLELKLEVDRLAILNTIEKVSRQLQGRITKREALAKKEKPARPWQLGQGFAARMRANRFEEEGGDDGVQHSESGGGGS